MLVSPSLVAGSMKVITPVGSAIIIVLTRPDVPTYVIVVDDAPFVPSFAKLINPTMSVSYSPKVFVTFTSYNPALGSVTLPLVPVDQVEGAERSVPV